MNYKDEIMNKAALRGIDFCVHFTNVTNLPSILQYGILPKKTMDEEWIEYNENDSLRLDGYPGATSLSFTSPNYRMFYKYRMQNPQKRWAVIVIDSEEVISLDCAYCYTNAANSRITDIPLDKLMTVQAFDAMFEEVDNQASRQRMRLSDSEPTDPQAEILVFDEIPPEAINYIFFDDYYTMQQYKPLLDKTHILCSCDRGPFLPRRDYSFWQ